MPRTKLNQSGFGLVDGLLIAIVVLLVGFIGYYVYSNNQENAKPEVTVSKSAVKTVNKKPATTVDETASWLLYQAPSSAYSLRLPDGWKFQRYMKGDSITAFNASDTVYVKGQPATISEVEFGRDFANLSYGLFYGDSANITINPAATEQTGFKTNQGLSVKKYMYTQVEEQQALGPSKGTITYSYYIVKGGKTMQISHDIATGEANKTDLVEKSTKTLVIN